MAVAVHLEIGNPVLRMSDQGHAATETKLRESRYSNYFEIGFNDHEVVIDCGQYYAGDAAPLIHTRLITSPAYAQYLLELLSDTLAQRKLAFGDPE